MGHYNHSLLLDDTIMGSKECPTIGYVVNIQVLETILSLLFLLGTIELLKVFLYCIVNVNVLPRCTCAIPFLSHMSICNWQYGLSLTDIFVVNYTTLLGALDTYTLNGKESLVKNLLSTLSKGVRCSHGRM